MNDPYRLVGLLIVALILFLPALIASPGLSIPELRSLIIGEKIVEASQPYVGLVDPVPPLTAWFYGVISFVFGESLIVRHILSLLIVLSQAIFFGIIFINHKAYVENTYIPSLIYLTLFGFSVDTLTLSGELIGLGFLLLALNNLLKELEFRSKNDGTILSLGFYISLASLCYFPYWLFVIAAALIVVFFSRREMRIFLLLITGFALPHLLLWGLYFMNDHQSELWTFFYQPNLVISRQNLMSSQALLWLGALPLLFVGAALVSLGKEARFSKYQSQVIQSMFLWAAFAFFQLAFARYISPQSFIALIPAFAFFIAHFFLTIQRRRLAGILLWILLVGVGSTQLLARHHMIPGVRYSNLYVDSKLPYENKRILVLADDLSYYVNNQLATPFLSWELSRPIIGETDYFENLIRVNDAVTEDPPEIIIDPDRMMDEVFERIPRLRKEYQREGPGVLIRSAGG